jgi:hypothetical protein
MQDGSGAPSTGSRRARRPPTERRVGGAVPPANRSPLAKLFQRAILRAEPSCPKGMQFSHMDETAPLGAKGGARSSNSARGRREKPARMRKRRGLCVWCSVVEIVPRAPCGTGPQNASHRISTRMLPRGTIPATLACCVRWCVDVGDLESHSPRSAEYHSLFSRLALQSARLSPEEYNRVIASLIALHTRCGR